MKKRVALICSIAMVLIAIGCVVAIPNFADVSLHATEAGSITFEEPSDTSHIIQDTDATDGAATSYDVDDGSSSYNAQTDQIVMNNDDSLTPDNLGEGSAIVIVDGTGTNRLPLGTAHQYPDATAPVLSIDVQGNVTVLASLEVQSISSEAGLALTIPADVTVTAQSVTAVEDISISGAGTLTVNGTGISSEGGVTIEGVSVSASSIYGTGDVSISGAGTLAVNGTGISSQGAISLNGVSGTVVSTENGISGSSVAITGGDLTVSTVNGGLVSSTAISISGGTVTASATNGGAIVAAQSVTISNATVNLGSQSDRTFQGISAGEDITVSENSQVTIYSFADGVESKDGEVSISATVTVDTAMGFGIKAPSLTMESGTLYVTVGTNGTGEALQVLGAGGLNLLGGETVVTTHGEVSSISLSHGLFALSGSAKLSVYHLGASNGGAITSSSGNFSVSDNAKVYLYHQSTRGIQLSSGALNVSGGQLEIYSASESGIPLGGAASYSFTGGVVLFHAPNKAILDTDVIGTIENAYFVGNTGIRTFTAPADATTAYDRAWDDASNSTWMYWSEKASYQYYNNKVDNYPGVLMSKDESYVFTAPLATDHNEHLLVGQDVFDGSAETLAKNAVRKFSTAPVIEFADVEDKYAGVSWDFNGEYGLNFEYIKEDDDAEGRWFVVGNNEKPAVVQVINEGDVKILVDLRYSENEESALFGDFDVSWATTLGGVPATKHSSGDGYLLSKSNALNFTLNITGEPQEEMNGVVAGTLTIYLATFMEYDKNIDHTILAANAATGTVEIYDLDDLLTRIDFNNLDRYRKPDGSYELVVNDITEFRDSTRYSTKLMSWNGREEVQFSGIDDSLTAAKMRKVKNDKWASGEGKTMLVTTSSNSMGDICIFFVNDETGEITASYKFWAIETNGDGPHDLEILPNGDLIIATTNGKYLLYIRLSQMQSIPSHPSASNRVNLFTSYSNYVTKLNVTDGSDGAHGVCYVPGENGQVGYLWVLSDNRISKVNIVNYGKENTSLEYSGEVCSFSNYDDKGHALTPILGAEGLFTFSAHSNVWIFDSVNMKILPMDDIYQCDKDNGICGSEDNVGNVKGIVYFEDGTAVMLPAGYNVQGTSSSTVTQNHSSGFHIVVWVDGVPVHIKIADRSQTAGFYKVFPYSNNYQ